MATTVSDAEFRVKITAAQDGSFDAVFKSAAGQAKEATEAVKGLGSGIVILNQALELGTKALEYFIEPIKEFAAESVEAFKNGQQAVTKFSNILALSGQYSEKNLESFRSFADELGRLLGIDDDLTLSLLGQAKVMGLTDDKAKQMVKTAANLSAVTGESLEGSFSALQASLTGVGRGLSKIDPQIKKFSEDQLKAGAAVEYLDKRLGDLAEQSAKTIKGLEQIKGAAFEDLKKAVGELIVDLIDYPARLESSIETIRTITEYVKNDLSPTLIDARDNVQLFFEAFKSGIASVDFGKLANDLVSFQLAIAGIGAVIGGAAIFQIGSAFASWSAPLAAAAKTFLLIPAAIAVTVVSVQILYRNFELLASTIGKSFVHVYNEIKLMIDKINLAMAEGLVSITKTVGLDAPFQSMVEKYKQSVADLRQENAQILLDTDELKDNLDLGDLDTVMEQAANFMTSFEDKVESATGTTEKFKKEITNLSGMKPLPDLISPEILKEGAKALDDIKSKSFDLNIELARQNGYSQTAIDLEYMKEEAAINALEASMRAAKMLDDENGQAAQLLKIYRELNAEKKAGKENETPATLGDIQGKGFVGGAAIISQEYTKGIESGLKNIKVKDIGDKVFSGISTILQAPFKMGAEIFSQALSFVFENKAAAAFEKLQGLPDLIGKEFQRFGDIADNFGTTFANGVQNLIKNLPTIVNKFVTALPGIVQSIADGLPKMMDAIAAAVPKLVDAIVSAMPKIANALGSMIAKLGDILADAIPKLMDGILKSLPALIDGVMKAINTLIPAIGKALESFVKALPSLIGQILKALPEILNTLIDALMSLIDTVIETLPDLIMTILDNLPKIIQKIIEGIIGLVGQLVVSLVSTFSDPEIVTKLAFSLVKAIVLVVVEGIIGGIIKGIGRVIESIGKAFQKMIDKFSGKKTKVSAPAWIEDLPGQTTKALEQVGKAVKKASGDIFKVEDLKASAKGANMALTSPEQVQKMGQQAVAAISKAGEGFLAKLKEAWLWVLDKVLTPIWNLVTKAWRWVWTQVIQPIIGIVETAWQMVIDFIRNIPEFVRLAWEFVISFFQTFGALISDAWSGIMNFFQSLGSVLSEAWSGVISSLKGITDAFGQVFEQGASLLSGVWNSAKEIFGGIGDALKSTFAGIGQFFNGITEGFKKLLDFDFSGFKTAIGDAFSTAGESIKGIFRKILQPIIDLMNGLKLQRVDVGFELFKKSYSFTLIPEMDLIPGELALPFARGGLVPAYAADGGFFEPRGTDTVPAMLTPGEFVVNRSATAGNLDALQRINAGKGSGGDVQIGSIVINAKSDLSTDSIRREVIPELFKQIKKRSQEGEFIIASAGVR